LALIDITTSFLTNKKLQVDLAEIFREGQTWPNLEVNRFWWCCFLVSTAEKIGITLLGVCTLSTLLVVY